MDVRAFGSWMSAPKCLFFQDSEGLTEAFAPGRRRDIRVDVRAISGPKPLAAWAIRNAIRANRFARESFATETPIFIARQANLPESLPLKFPTLGRSAAPNLFMLGALFA